MTEECTISADVWDITRPPPYTQSDNEYFTFAAEEAALDPSNTPKRTLTNRPFGQNTELIPEYDQLLYFDTYQQLDRVAEFVVTTIRKIRDDTWPGTTELCWANIPKNQLGFLIFVEGNKHFE